MIGALRTVVTSPTTIACLFKSKSFVPDRYFGKKLSGRSKLKKLNKTKENNNNTAHVDMQEGGRGVSMPALAPLRGSAEHNSKCEMPTDGTVEMFLPRCSASCVIVCVCVCVFWCMRVERRWCVFVHARSIPYSSIFIG